jgi:hypothetical protein
MSADVRIKIEHYKRVLTTMQNEVFGVVLGVTRNAAEDALARL